MTKIPFKIGATFAPVLTFAPAPGGLPNLIGATITSQIRMGPNLLSALTPVLAPDGLSFTLSVPGGTSSWPAGDAIWDVKIVVGGSTYYSDTAIVAITRGVTQ
jgi:hypothetical protein